MTVEVREFAVRNGTMFVGGDLEVGGAGSAVSTGTLRGGGDREVGGQMIAGPGFEQEVRMFLGGECPPGWVEASETMGRLLASRGGSEAAGANKSNAGISVTAASHSHTYRRFGNNDLVNTNDVTVSITTTQPRRPTALFSCSASASEAVRAAAVSTTLPLLYN